MNFERPSQEQKRYDISKMFEKKTSEFREFLSEQVLLPKKEWGNEFKRYVEEKAAGSKLENYKSTKEEEQELTFKRYLKGLDLDMEKLRNKKILDIGCGEDGEFVKECIDSGITNTIHGFDMRIEPEKLTKYSEHFQKGLMQEDIPIKNMDYVLSAGAMSLVREKKGIKQVLLKVIDTLNETGELRIWPLGKASQESDLEGIKEARENWVEVLNNLSSEIGIEYEFKPIDIVVSGKNEDVWLEEVLIIRKKNQLVK